MIKEDELFPEQRESAKIHGISDDVPKMKDQVKASDEKTNAEQPGQEDIQEEGHVKEWQDRARVVLDAKEAVHQPSVDKQSPTEEDVEEKSDRLENNY